MKPLFLSADDSSPDLIKLEEVPASAPTTIQSNTNTQPEPIKTLDTNTENKTPSPSNEKASQPTAKLEHYRSWHEDKRRGMKVWQYLALIPSGERQLNSAL